MALYATPTFNYKRRGSRSVCPNQTFKNHYRVVSDPSGVTLPGVSVTVKGTKVSTQTNPQGFFSIDVPAGNDVLTISYIGMTTQDVVIGERKTLKVELQETSSKLNEVVVIGYGSTRRSEVTSSISSVTEKDIKNLPLPV